MHSNHVGFVSENVGSSGSIGQRRQRTSEKEKDPAASADHHPSDNHSETYVRGKTQDTLELSK